MTDDDAREGMAGAGATAEARSNGHGRAPAERLLTAEEVAEILRVTATWVYEQSRAGRIPPVRLGRNGCCRPHAIAAWSNSWITAGPREARRGRNRPVERLRWVWRPIGATVDEIAQRTVELLADQARKPFRLLDTQAVARMLGMSGEWVRDHAAELGAIRLGDGPKGALRFDASRVRAVLESRRLDPPRAKQRQQAGPRRRSMGVLPADVPADVKDW
jgi:predicted DNA-binding transcriptional regulator AlpA